MFRSVHEHLWKQPLIVSKFMNARMSWLSMGCGTNFLRLERGESEGLFKNTLMNEALYIDTDQGRHRLLSV